MTSKRRRYRIGIEDRSRLKTVGSITMTVPELLLAALGAAGLAIIFGALVVMSTPLRTLLPGYLKPSERNASVSSLMRLDSLQQVYNRNQQFIDNFMRVTEISHTPDSVAYNESSSTREMPVDSIVETSAAEKIFVEAMKDREKYNLTVLTPLAADGMMFGRPARQAVFSKKTLSENRAAIVAATDQPVVAVADGTVIASYYSPAEGGYAVAIQHLRGFVSRISHVGLPVVAEGDMVSVGQVVSLPRESNTAAANVFYLEMWHNGVALKPYEVIGGL